MNAPQQKKISDELLTNLLRYEFVQIAFLGVFEFNIGDRITVYSDERPTRIEAEVQAFVQGSFDRVLRTAQRLNDGSEKALSVATASFEKNSSRYLYVTLIDIALPIKR